MRSESVLITAQGRTKEDGEGNQARQAEEDIEEYVSDQVLCRRLILSRVMDGFHHRTRCAEGEALCDLCEAAREARQQQPAEDNRQAIATNYNAQVVRRRAIQHSRTVQAQINDIVRGLRFFKNNCALCKMGCKEGYAAHEYSVSGQNCTIDREVVAKHADAIQTLGDIVRRKELPRYHACWHCYAPQGYCERWRAKAGDEGSFVRTNSTRCTYSLVISQVVAAGMVFNRLKVLKVAVRIVRTQGVPIPETISWEDFLCTRVRLGSMQTVGLVIIFLLLSKPYS